MALYLSKQNAKTLLLRDFLATPLPLLQSFQLDFERFTLTDIIQIAQAYKREMPIVFELTGTELKVDDYVKIREQVPENVIIMAEVPYEDLAPEDMAKLKEYI